MISGFRRDADKICSLLGYYASHSGSSVPTFRDNLSVLHKVMFKRHLAPAELGFGTNEHYSLSVFNGLVCQKVVYITLSFFTNELTMRWCVGAPLPRV